MSFLRGLRVAGRSGFIGTESLVSAGSLAAEGSVGACGSLSAGPVGGRWLVVLTGGDEEQNKGDTWRLRFAIARCAVGT